MKVKKSIKIIIGIIGIIILSIVIDYISILLINRPVFALKDGNVYRGLFFDTYSCLEYSVPVIKRKDLKFSCATDKISIGEILEIVDKSKEIEDFMCAEVLEEFFEDNTYSYYFSCMKSSYVVVKYENGFEESVEDALANKTIRIDDLDKYHIDYIKYKK